MNTPSPRDNYSVGVIGCGHPLGAPGSTGFGMGHRHMTAFAKTGRCRLAGAANRTVSKAEAFVEVHGPDAPVFGDYREMLHAVRPDIVSICLWTPLHEEAVLAAVEVRPKLIFCEKPIATHWDAALRMHEACAKAGIVLAYNHQRRFNRPLLKAKELLEDGAIGPLQRIEAAWRDLGDTGSHAVDMMFYFNDDVPAEWVLGQIDMRGANQVFGHLHAGQGLAQMRFANGVRGLYQCGHQHEELGCLVRLIGEDGLLEILQEEPWLRLRRYGHGDWEAIDTGETIHDDTGIDRAVAHVLECMEAGRESELDSARALRPTEVLFAVHESARRRARIDLPLPPGPCALLGMLESGELSLVDEAKEVFGGG
ncbi:MAG: Gfo/Idh/MocA family protein [Opitutales bacterium]